MSLPTQIYIIWLITCLTWLNEYTDANVSEQCPIGFNLAHTKSYGTICYKLKGPEKFEDKFENCVGNLYNINRYFSLGLPTTNKVLWAEYKSLHDGEPFMDWSYTKNISTIFENVPFEHQFGKDNKLCMVIDPVTNLTATECYNRHFRYCFVEPYRSKPIRGRCDHGFSIMYAPRAVCVTEKNNVNVTWKQAVELCENSTASLLSKGWMYSNFNSSEKQHPLGSRTDRDLINKEIAEVLKNDWLPLSPVQLKAMDKTSVISVNKSHLFDSVMCEKSIQLKHIDMKLSAERYYLKLVVNDTIYESHIRCFDAFMNAVPFRGTSLRNMTFWQHANFDSHSGYYWCYHVDYIHYHPSKSNIFILLKEEYGLLRFLYAVTIQWCKGYFPTDLNDLIEVTKNVFNKMINGITEQQLDRMRVKRVYFEERKAMLIISLSDSQVNEMTAAMDNLKVLKIKRAYICDDDIRNTTKLGKSVQSDSCLIKFVGDFDEGVDEVESVDSGCTTPLNTSVVTAPYYVDEKSTAEKPSKQLDLAMNDLDSLLQNDTILLHDVSNALDQVNNVLDFEGEELEVPGRLLEMLDELGSRAELAGQPTAKTVRGNIALLTADVSSNNPIRGMRMAARAAATFDNDTFSFISDVNSSYLETNNSEAVVFLPESILRTSRRVSFVTFRNEVAFRSNLSINSRIFSVNVQNVTHFENGEVVDIHLSPLEAQPGGNVRRTCAYWQFPGDGGGGHWDETGCRLLVGGAGQLDTCRCSHLTHFAEVLVPRTVFSEPNEAALQVISLVGCFSSAFGIIGIGLTAALFRSWRRDYCNKIWLQLSAAILALVVCFILAALVDFRDDLTCTLVGVALHYSVLVSFCWMLVAAALSYRRLVLVFALEASHKLLRAAAFAWGLPCGVVGALLAIRPQAYARPPAGAGFCYPTGLALWLTVYAPVCVALLVNGTLFALIVRWVFRSRRFPRHGNHNESLRCAVISCLLVFLFGLPWIFGLFAFDVVAAYLFTLTGTFQGFVLFMFFVVGSKKTRDLWLNKLKIKRTRYVRVTLSTVA